MKKLNTLSKKMAVVAIIILVATSLARGQPPQNEKESCEKITFIAPALKCGEIKWDDPVIFNWIKNYCVEKCDDSISSGYLFKGKINGTDKNNSLKVTITTDRDYAQPVRFNPVTGTFEGKLFFDKTIREETTVKLMLRDSNRLVINTFIVKLTD